MNRLSRLLLAGWIQFLGFGALVVSPLFMLIGWDASASFKSLTRFHSGMNFVQYWVSPAGQGVLSVYLYGILIECMVLVVIIVGKHNTTILRMLNRFHAAVSFFWMAACVGFLLSAACVFAWSFGDVEWMMFLLFGLSVICLPAIFLLGGMVLISGGSRSESEARAVGNVRHRMDMPRLFVQFVVAVVTSGFLVFSMHASLRNGMVPGDFTIIAQGVATDGAPFLQLKRGGNPSVERTLDYQIICPEPGHVFIETSPPNELMEGIAQTLPPSNGVYCLSVPRKHLRDDGSFELVFNGRSLGDGAFVATPDTPRISH